ncbi:helix-turn-helix transcriptional regulator [Lachnospiraceae bacterium OttesenSCG-928-J05]|nr:helix-turn-helix transcriptional regulator [Lachnospiraceae bacterium OttesenSCG-928-J05]
MGVCENKEATCPIEVTVQIIGNKWRPLIIYYLLDGEKRFNELKRLLKNVSQKVLTDNLRILEEQGIVIRTVYPEVPVRVEYQLSESGMGLSKVIGEMQCWASEYQG